MSCIFSPQASVRLGLHNGEAALSLEYVSVL